MRFQNMSPAELWYKTKSKTKKLDFDKVDRISEKTKNLTFWYEPNQKQTIDLVKIKNSAIFPDLDGIIIMDSPRIMVENHLIGYYYLPGMFKWIYVSKYNVPHPIINPDFVVQTETKKTGNQLVDSEKFNQTLADITSNANIYWFILIVIFVVALIVGCVFLVIQSGTPY